MITILMFVFALALSGVAAFYSIAGLIAIFAASPISIAVMGSILEGSKLVIASWLYRNWKQVPRLMKGYFVSALAILMFLTSMGIFGYLSKAHLDQAVPTGDIAAKVDMIDQQINTEKENINAARQTLAQLDQQVNETITRTTDAAGTNRSIAIRRAQAKERAQLAAEITKAQAAIAKLNEERAPIATELRKVEAEVGPIKYIAALIYGDEATSDQALLERAVRWVTILIVAVFDPLAVIMLIAANWSVVNRKKPTAELSNEIDQPVVEKTPDDTSPPSVIAEEESILDKHPYLTKPFVHFQGIKPVVAKPDPIEPPVVSVAEPVEPPPAPQPLEQPLPEGTEHPAFQPTEDFWRSRPPRG